MAAIFFWQVIGPQQITASFLPDSTLPKQVAQVNAQHPFGVVSGHGAEAASQAVDESSGWRLLATLASVGGRGMALLDREGGEVKVVQNGDLLAPGQQVTGISANVIELSGIGGKRRIELAPVLAAESASVKVGDSLKAGVKARSPLNKDGGEPPASEIVNVSPRPVN